MSPVDESAFLRGMVTHFGADAVVPMQVPSDFWNATAAKISKTLAVRHGGLCLPVIESEERFILAVTRRKQNEEELTWFACQGPCLGCQNANSLDRLTLPHMSGQMAFFRSVFV